MRYVSPRLVRVALGLERADVIVKGGKLVDVYARRIRSADVAIAEGRIAAVGDVTRCIGRETEVIEAGGRYLAPGLIDAHIHPEVTKLTITRLAEALIPRGITSLMCSFEQVGAVAGVNGIRFMLDEAKRTPLKLWHSAPSRLPYTTPASTIAHRFGPEEHRVAQQWEEAVGIWEYLADSIEDFDPPVYEAAEIALQNRLTLHGHAPVADGRTLAACAAGFMRDDHESYSAEELVEKVANGIYGLIRRGTHSDNIPECVRAITELGLDPRHLALCTDDVDCLDILEIGAVDYVARYVIRLGIDPLTAIQMASLNAAECYRVDQIVGSIAPGRIADILLLGDLPSLKVDAVIANGRLVASGGKVLERHSPPEFPSSFRNTVRFDRRVSAEDLVMCVDRSAFTADVRCVHLDLSEGLLCRGRDVTLPVDNGRVLPDPVQDVLHVSVTDRHSGNGTTGLGFISGFGLKRGAIATSLAPDDDNIICVGASAGDMAAAINRLAELGGGQVAVEAGRVLAELPLPLCGLMADVSLEEMVSMERQLNQAAYNLGTQLTRPFFFLMFLSITAIPDYAMTDRGMVQHSSRAVIDPVYKVTVA